MDYAGRLCERPHCSHGAASPCSAQTRPPRRGAPTHLARRFSVSEGARCLDGFWRRCAGFGCDSLVPKFSRSQVALGNGCRCRAKLRFAAASSKSLSICANLWITFPVKATHARLATVLESIPNIGASIARDLRSIGIKKPQDLIGQDALSLYQALSNRTRARQDPCVLDTFISAVRFMEGARARPWWSYTAERKKKFPASLLGAPSHAVASARGGSQDGDGTPATISSAHACRPPLRFLREPTP
jgi:hypothetical protein